MAASARSRADLCTSNVSSSPLTKGYGSADDLDPQDLGALDRELTLAGQRGAPLVDHVGLERGVVGELEEVDLRGLRRTAGGTARVEALPAVIGQQRKHPVLVVGQLLLPTESRPEQHAQ